MFRSGLVPDGSIVEGLVALWQEMGMLTKVGLVAQAATWGLLAAAIRTPTRGVIVAALIACTLGFLGLSLTSLGEAEYVMCGALDAPTWCGR